MPFSFFPTSTEAPCVAYRLCRGLAAPRAAGSVDPRVFSPCPVPSRPRPPAFFLFAMIDVHTHLFNAAYVPIRGIVDVKTSLGPRLAGIIDRIARTLVRIDRLERSEHTGGQC